MKRRKSRIGVDLDSHSRWQLLRVLFNARYMFPDFSVEVYETRHGYHLKVKIPWEKCPNHKKRLEVRKSLNDDCSRIYYDERRLRCGLESWVDTLFSWKRHPDGTMSREEPCNPLSEPFWSVLPARKNLK